MIGDLLAYLYAGGVVAVGAVICACLALDSWKERHRDGMDLLMVVLAGGFALAFALLAADAGALIFNG